MTEDRMVGWPHQLNGPVFEQALEDGEGQGSLECFDYTDLSQQSDTPAF